VVSSADEKARISEKIGNYDAILIIEPWASEYVLPAGKSFDVIAEGDLSCPLELEVGQDHITIYVFDSAGAIVSVQDNGEAVKERGT
jgi:hypothetical protein